VTRRAYVDWARGLAVLIMIEAHAVDAWTRAADRSSPLFGYLLVLGGFAAPLFLGLAGLGLALSGQRRQIAEDGGRRAAAKRVVRRGIVIFILAFLFRLQAFVISPGSSPVTLFRVDILNVMGPAIAVTGLLWAAGPGGWRGALACALTASSLAMATPIVRHASWVGLLPTWFQWYLRPSGDHTTFTLLPWAGFVMAGAAAGALHGAFTARAERRWVHGMALAGIALIAGGLYASHLPSIYRASSFWTSSPTYFAVRVGIVLLVVAAFYALSPVAQRVRPPFRALERFGRNSLFIYWIHVELVYGYATWIIHGRLPLWAVLGCYLVFCAAMLGATYLRDSLVAYWRSGGPVKPSSTTAEPVPL
jgi:uncharacterized membrane protein